MLSTSTLAYVSYLATFFADHIGIGFVVDQGSVSLQGVNADFVERGNGDRYFVFLQAVLQHTATWDRRLVISTSSGHLQPMINIPQ